MKIRGESITMKFWNILVVCYCCGFISMTSPSKASDIEDTAYVTSAPAVSHPSPPPAEGQENKENTNSSIIEATTHREAGGNPEPSDENKTPSNTPDLAASSVARLLPSTTATNTTITNPATLAAAVSEAKPPSLLDKLMNAVHGLFSNEHPAEPS